MTDDSTGKCLNLKYTMNYTFPSFHVINISSGYGIVVMEHTVAVCLTQQKYVEVNSCYAYNQYAEQARKLSAIA